MNERRFRRSETQLLVNWSFAIAAYPVYEPSKPDFIRVWFLVTSEHADSYTLLLLAYMHKKIEEREILEQIVMHVSDAHVSLTLCILMDYFFWIDTIKLR